MRFNIVQIDELLITGWTPETVMVSFLSKMNSSEMATKISSIINENFII